MKFPTNQKWKTTMTLDEFEGKIKRAEPGDQIIYWLGVTRGPFGKAAYSHYGAGNVLLVQRAHGKPLAPPHARDFDYIAVRTSRKYKQPKGA